MSDADPAPRLFAVYLGGAPAPGRLGEDHEVVLVAASDAVAARRRAKTKWGGSGRAHVDAIAPVRVVDGFTVHLVPSELAEDAEVDTTYSR